MTTCFCISMKVTFFGGSKTVTGANYLIEYDGAKLLVDCGMLQGVDFVEHLNYDPFPFDPATIDYLFVTHSHIDHVGRVPKLVRDGFRGKIVCTAPSADLAKLSLRDSVQIIAQEARLRGKPPFFTMADVQASDQYFEPHNYFETIKLPGGANVKILSAGHVLGSAMYTFEIEGKILTFTGDLGNAPAPLIGPPDHVGPTDYLVIESAYGDRKHPPQQAGMERLREIVEQTIKRGGTLLIPSFALERTQIVLFHLNNLVESGAIPAIPVYVDSPLAINITKVYRKYESYFKSDIQSQIAHGDQIFDFPMLRMSSSQDESKAINRVKGPKIIIAGNGMSTGGRILFHEMRYLSNPNNTILLVGYQVQNSLGRQILDRKDYIHIFGKKIELRAHVEQISSFSAHADNPQLIHFVTNNITNQPREIFVVQGEETAAEQLAFDLSELGYKAYAPHYNESFTL